MAKMILIDAHGPDHGLSCEIKLRTGPWRRRFGDSTVVIRQWAECDEPDEHGSYSPHIQRAEIPLRDLLAEGPHHGVGYIDDSSQWHKVLHLALNWLAYWGGEEDFVDDADRPCRHFRSYWGRHQADDASQRVAHFTCETCGALPLPENEVNCSFTGNV